MRQVPIYIVDLTFFGAL